ncbi:hypothetical protein [Lelliottia wanjuensis]|uniref:hypothetical protein n=1 Tax=Lelliottia wanjuensis TaxID=3050585 RepID=UPI00254B54CC|nr:hypothetical protein [Lelliottia sp. V86_10]MDK9586722.1 hypothetical protein [Lelliottia sp. V86_10]
MKSQHSKLKAIANAQERSRLATRHTSLASVDNEQSEVTRKPPTIYQVPKINVPHNLEEFAKLLHQELTSIAQSQSIILTLWEQHQASQLTIAKLQARVNELSESQSWAGINCDNKEP